MEQAATKIIVKYDRLRTLDDVRAAKPDMIYYGAMTCWWAYRGEHLYRNRVGLPCDPRGGMLMQTEDWQKFLATAEQKSDHYGRHGLRAFEAALHGNVLVLSHRTGKWVPTCFTGWEQYNLLLDHMAGIELELEA